MTIKPGLNAPTLIIAAIVLWIIYGAFKGGQAYAATASSNDYAATT